MSSRGRIVLYDTESSGVDKDYDQIYQLAAVQADEQLNLIPGSEINLLCKPRRDVIPSPDAFLVHHLDIETLKHAGMSEYELAKEVRRLFRSDAPTGIMGYNNFAYDDEMTRRLLFRNGFPPYEHEFKNGNYRADIYGLVQMAYAFRPDLLTWPQDENGQDSLRLELLSEANGIHHENAHEALSDVMATLELAKRVRQGNERLWRYFLRMTDKNAALSLLMKPEPLLYVSGFIQREFRHASLVLPLIKHPNNSNAVLAVDLRYDPTEMLTMSGEELRHYLFTPRHELEENAPHLPLMAIPANKQPLLVPADKMLSDPDVGKRLQIDEAVCREHLQRVMGHPSFRQRAQEAFKPSHQLPLDAGATIYSGGFLSRKDEALRDNLHMMDHDTAPAAPHLVTRTPIENAGAMGDCVRQFQLITRARWNSFAPEVLKGALGPSEAYSLSPFELSFYADYLDDRLFSPHRLGNGLSLAQARERISEIEMERALSEDQQAILGQLSAHYDTLEESATYFRSLSDELAPPNVVENERRESDTANRLIEGVRRERQAKLAAAEPTPDSDIETPSP